MNTNTDLNYLVKTVLNEYKRIHIVHYDWLEFSAVANRRLPEREYSMRNILSKENAARRERNRLENGRRQGEKSVNPSMLRFYTLSLNQYTGNLTCPL